MVVRRIKPGAHKRQFGKHITNKSIDNRMFGKNNESSDDKRQVKRSNT